MENHSIDFSALKSLIEILEKIRAENSTLFSSCNKRATVLRGWFAVYSKNKKELHPIMISASATSKQDNVHQKIEKNLGTDFDTYTVAVAVFQDDQLNRIIEVIFGYYMKYRKTHKPFYIYRQILVTAQNHSDTSVLYTKKAARIFLKEHA